MVVDPAPMHRRARPWLAPHDSVDARLALALGEASGQGLEISGLTVRIGATPTELAAHLETAPGVVRIGARIFDARGRAELVATVVRSVDAHHAKHPLDPGAALQTIRAQLTGRPELIDDAIRVAAEQGSIETDGGIVRRTGWIPRLSSDQSSLKSKLVDLLRAAGAEPPSVAELTSTDGPSVPPLLRLLEREGAVIPVDSERYYEVGALTLLVGRLRSGMVGGREYSPSELRDVIGLSRKYLIPFLEYCDRRGITERRSAGRVLHGT
jgi:selenocysteine-specific elongation factor